MDFEKAKTLESLDSTLCEIPLGEKHSLTINVTEMSKDLKKHAQVILKGVEGSTVFDRFTFQVGESFAYDLENGAVTIPTNGISEPREIFILLHEMGHIALFNKSNEKFKQLFLDRSKGTSQSIEGFNAILPEERGAWAEAIRMARELKQQGVDLFGLFQNVDDFQGYIRAMYLRSYELGQELAGNQAFTKDASVAKWLTDEKVSLLTEEEKRGLEVLFAFSEEVPSAIPKIDNT